MIICAARRVGVLGWALVLVEAETVGGVPLGIVVVIAASLPQ